MNELSGTFRWLGTIAALLLVSSAAHAVPIQWSSAAGGNDHYYEVISGPLNWQDAAADAATRVHLGASGYLATITSAGERDFIAALLAGRGQTWIGANDLVTEGAFVWAGGPQSGQALSFTKWGLGEPNDLRGEDCTVVSNNAERSWNDLACVFGEDYVVEFNAAAVNSVSTCLTNSAT